MDVKIGKGAWMAQPAGKTPQKQQKTGATTSFAALLRPETSAKAAQARDEKDFSGQTPDEVFTRALADRSDPDLDSLDDYMEWLIRH